MAELVMKTLHPHNNLQCTCCCQGIIALQSFEVGAFFSKADLAIYYW